MAYSIQGDPLWYCYNYLCLGGYMFGIDEIIKELEREIKMRKEVFGRWVLQGRMSENTKNKRIQIMEQILEDYKQKQIHESGQATLFEEV